MGKPLSFNQVDRDLWIENTELRAKLAAAEKREAELAQGIIVNCKLCRKDGVGRLPGACEKCPTSLIEATALKNQKGR